jgi:hypothetical protein
MQTLKEVVFESRDTLSEMSAMLLLVEKNISELEHQGEEIAIKGCSSVLWSVISKHKELEDNMSKALKDK